MDYRKYDLLDNEGVKTVIESNERLLLSQPDYELEGVKTDVEERIKDLNDKVKKLDFRLQILFDIIYIQKIVTNKDISAELDMNEQYIRKLKTDLIKKLNIKPNSNRKFNKKEIEDIWN
jgi:hypothetical protein